MKAPLWFCAAAIMLAWSVAAPATPNLELEGTLYELGSQRRKKLYEWKMKTCPGVWTSSYRRLDGTLVVEDETRFAGQRFSEYRYVRHTIGERASVKLNGTRLTFNYARAGQTKSKTLTTDEVFVTGPAVFAFIERHLPRLRAGKELEFKFGVLDRLDYFTFNLRNDSPHNSSTSRIEIRATSLFVRMAVDPIYVTVSKNGRFRGISGRSIIMEMRGGKRVPIDADLVVESETPAQCPPALR